MAEVLAKIVGPPHPWLVQTDPNGKLTLMLSAPITVLYSTGASDTLSAGTPATECPLDPAFVWALYVVPGTPTLHAVKESEIITLSGDWTILGHIHQHEVLPHQPGGAAVGAGAGGAGDVSGAAVTFVINGDGAAITTGEKGSLVVPFVCTITSAYVIADVASTTTVDVAKADYSSYPTTTSIVASAPPTLSASDKSLDTTLTGWTVDLAAGDVLTFDVTANDNATELSVVLLVTRPTALEWVIDGEGNIIPTGITGSLTVPFPCTISSATLLADTSGGIVVDIWRSNYTGYPPSSADTICGSSPPTISSAQKSQDTTLSGWSPQLAVGDILVFSVTSCSTITRCSVVLMVQRS